MAFASTNDAIAALSSVKATKSDIVAFVRKLSVDCSGSVTALYSGKIGDANAWEFLKAAGDDVRRIDRTMAAEVLNSDEFKAKVAQIFKLTPDAFDKLPATDPAKLWLNKGGSGPWAVASEMFVEGTTTPIRFLTLDPDANSVLVKNEWKKALEGLGSGRIPSLEGLTAVDLQGLTPTQALERMKASSAQRGQVLQSHILPLHPIPAYSCRATTKRPHPSIVVVMQDLTPSALATANPERPRRIAFLVSFPRTIVHERRVDLDSLRWMI